MWVKNRYLNNSLYLNPVKIVITALILMLITGCEQTNKSPIENVIAVSILPQKYFVQKITGDKYKILVMIPPGAGHESYDPTPSQLIQLSEARVYFRNGYLDFENNWVGKFMENFPNLEFIDLSDGLDLIENTDNEHHLSPIEPHTWMSPRNVKQMARTIFETMIEIDLKNKEFYSANYQNFSSELDILHSSIENKFKHSDEKSFIIYHPALTYYAHDYNLTQYSIETEGKTPSAFHIKTLIDIAKKENIKTILVQRQYDKSRAETLARETGSKIIEIDPLNENWEKEIIDITDKILSTYNNSVE